MKKKLFYLFALICSVSLFTACSDNDDDAQGSELITGPMVGTWQLADIVTEDDGWGGQTVVSGPVKVTWETSDPALTLPMMGMNMPINVLAPLAERMTSPMLVQVLKDITLTPEGDILATYAKKAENPAAAPAEPQWQVAEGYATYKKVSDNQILVFLNLEKIMAQAKTRAAEDAIGTLMQLVQNGIPVNVSYDEAGAPRFFIDQALVEKVVPAVTALLNIIPTTPQNESTIKMVKDILAGMPAVLEKTTKLEIGLQMKK